ncbi:30S ribosomal protein S21 [Patescibacteria group bacterium]|nr:30S ribosomal protein S21 [Patescibacteria group bacterium]MBU4453415.1 30S ribosomal protein S21 [Patescibacteria group bacterium]MCG2687853.1 30S ribosomal protein S21 [Candidatus Parcubacteria bacterium]
MSDILIRRKKGESFEAMYRRFSRRFQQSGKKLTLMDRRFFKKKKTKNKRQESALRGLTIGEKRDWLIRTGKLVEDEKFTKR